MKHKHTQHLEQARKAVLDAMHRLDRKISSVEGLYHKAHGIEVANALAGKEDKHNTRVLALHRSALIDLSECHCELIDIVNDLK